MSCATAKSAKTGPEILSVEQNDMLTYRKHLLSKVQDRYDLGSNANTPLLSKSVFDAVDVRAEGNDPTAKFFQKSLIEKADQIIGPESYLAWDGLYDCYTEALVYLLARERKVWLEHIPTGDSSTPDFLGKSPSGKEARFEVKTLNISGGEFSQDEMAVDGLSAKYEAQTDAQKHRVGFGIHVISPHGAGATGLDAVRQTIDKIRGNVRRGQYTNYPSYLIVSLDRLCLSTSVEDMSETYKDHLGDTVSGHLFALALSKADDTFIYTDCGSPGTKKALLGREGVLREFDYVAGVIFLSAVWQELAEFDGAFRHSAYRMFGFRRGSADDPIHEVFDGICDHVSYLN